MEIAALVISIVSLGASIGTFIFSWVIERNRETIDAYSNLQTSLFYLYRYEHNEIEDFVTDKESEEYKVLGGCLANIEVFASGVKSRAYSLRLTYGVAHGYIDKALRNKIDYLIEMREEGQVEEYYQNTKWLLKKMDAKSIKKSHRR